jgi:hypothetical protein
LAGGGLRTGQVIGETDRTASSVITRPISYKDVFATLYHALGIDPHRVTINDPRGRPLADISNCREITTAHVAEAVQYRQRTRAV